LENDEERERIARNGYETVKKYHSSKVRARQLVDFLRTLDS
jgi:spore maturation protein CgeB